MPRTSISFSEDDILSGTYYSSKPDDRYSRKYVLFTVIAFVGSLALLNKDFPDGLRLAFYLLIIMIGFKSVYATFFLLAASVILPDIGLHPVTATQLVLVAWLISWTLWSKNHRIFLPRKGLFPLSIFLMWLFVTAMMNSDFYLLSEVAKAVAVGFVAYHMTRLKNVRTDLCFMNVILGASLSIIPWNLTNIFGWTAYELENVRSSFFLSNGGYRYAISKQDPNAIALLINIAFWGAVNILLRTNNRKKRSSDILMIAICVFSLPPIIAAGSRGGLMVFIVSAAMTLLLWLIDISRGRKNHLREDRSWNRPSRRLPLGNAVILTCLFLIMLAIMAMSVKKSFNVPWNYQVTNTLERLRLYGLDDRAQRFSEAWSVIKNSPLKGIGTTEYLVRNVGKSPHNTALDVGVAAGVPGMILYILVMALPIFYSYRGLRWEHPTPSAYLVCYIVVVISMMSLSIIGDKFFWIFWFLIMVFCEQAQPIPVLRSAGP